MSGTMSRENRWLRLWPASRWSTATARATKVPTQANSVSEPDLVRADTLAEAAAALKLDADVLQKTIDDDNAACAASVDTEFAKPAASLVAVGTAPFYIAKLNQYYLMSVGGIECDINARVVDSAKTPSKAFTPWAPTAACCTATSTPSTWGGAPATATISTLAVRRPIMPIA